MTTVPLDGCTISLQPTIALCNYADLKAIFPSHDHELRLIYIPLSRLHFASYITCTYTIPYRSIHSDYFVKLARHNRKDVCKSFYNQTSAQTLKYAASNITQA